MRLAWQSWCVGVSVHYEFICNNGVDLPPLPLRPPEVEREREGWREGERGGGKEREREGEREGGREGGRGREREREGRREREE